MMSSTAIFDYGKYTSIAQKAGLHYTRTIKKYFVSRKSLWVALYIKQNLTQVYTVH